MRLARGAEVERLATGFKITILFAPSSTIAQNQGENDAITSSENKQWRRL